MGCVWAVVAVIGTGAFAFVAPGSAAAAPAMAGSASAAVTTRLPAVTDPAWATQSVPAPIVANGQLWAVSCASATACMAVGWNSNSVGALVPLAEQWNGSSWSIRATPSPAGSKGSSLSGVSCTSPTACTAAGNYTTSTGTQVTLAERWNGTSWAIQATPNPAGAQSSTLSGVSCPAATACTAAGNYTNSTGTQVTLAERWNGTSWTVQATPNRAGAQNSTLNGVSCTSAAACTAAGSYTTSTGTQVTLAERWNGTSWTVQATPNRAGAQNSTLNGVSCPTATVCAAVGGYTNSTGTGLTLAERWNGTSWTIQSTPNPAGAQNSTLNGVSCTSATACTAAGGSSPLNSIRTLAERWNGTSWSIQATPNPGGSPPNLLNGVSCSSATACTAVGGYVASNSILVTLAEPWNGTSWSVQATPNRTGAKPSRLNSVTCSSATACTAVGHSTEAFGPPDPLAERWNGTSWTIQATPSPGGAPSSLQGVSCPSATVCTAVGSSFSPSQPTLAERWNGTSWSIQATPSPAGAMGSSLSGVSCTSATACTATGDYVSGTGTTLALAERWNGTSWSIQATPSPAGAMGSSLRGVSCTSATACTATGDYVSGTGTTLALAERWNGTSWSIRATPSPAGAQGSALSGVSCTLATACTAVGNYTNSSGNVLTLAERWNGTSWTVQATPNPIGPISDTFVLNGVSCTSATACTAAGDTTDHDGVQVTLAESWNGTSWTIQATPSPGASAALNGVSCTSAVVCTAAGSYLATGASMPLAERYS